ncbi:hypothetical protein PIB30_067919 [Stylosanthes scabra]|uniref:Uncharacterized protein n=1 Tax=Stylosanthes scabra TaxID=79078 RepID=A0ABU6RMN2_9FABA|nr:hypothetical protein [Stylosanthes scabra]
MYALAIKGRTSPKLLTTFSSSLTPQSFNPRGIDTHFTVVLLDTIRYTCRDLGLPFPSNPMGISFTLTLEIPTVTLSMQGNRGDKAIIEFDPEIEKTLKKNRSRVKAQRALQF